MKSIANLLADLATPPLRLCLAVFGMLLLFVLAAIGFTLTALSVCVTSLMQLVTWLTLPGEDDVRD